MIFFLDASSVVKLYHDERGSETMHVLFGRPEYEAAFFVSDLVSLEVLVRLAKQGRGGGRNVRRAFHRVVKTYVHHRDEKLNVVDVDSGVVRSAGSIAMVYSSSGAGTLDLLHAASTRQVQKLAPEQPLVFVAADRKLRSLVERIGFRTFDPESGDLALL